MILTVMNPDPRIALAQRVRGIRLTDYIAVSHLDLHGTQTFMESMSLEDRVKLFKWCNSEEKRRNDELARRRHERPR